jgi:hypothetical protein
LSGACFCEHEPPDGSGELQVSDIRDFEVDGEFFFRGDHAAGAEHFVERKASGSNAAIMEMNGDPRCSLNRVELVIEAGRRSLRCHLSNGHRCGMCIDPAVGPVSPARECTGQGKTMVRSSFDAVQFRNAPVAAQVGPIPARGGWTRFRDSPHPQRAAQARRG